MHTDRAIYHYHPHGTGLSAIIRMGGTRERRWRCVGECVCLHCLSRPPQPAQTWSHRPGLTHYVGSFWHGNHPYMQGYRPREGGTGRAIHGEDIRVDRWSNPRVQRGGRPPSDATKAVPLDWFDPLCGCISPPRWSTPPGLCTAQRRVWTGHRLWSWRGQQVRVTSYRS
jgi:hypothetical protein